MSPQRHPFRFWIWILLVLMASSLAAQPQDDSIFGEEIEVRVVNLEVVVTDRQGTRVPGLTADDFYLEVDGQTLPVDFFSEIADGRRVETVGTLDAPEPSPSGLNPTGVAPGEEVGTSYLVFVDNVFSPRQRDRNQVLDGIRGQLTNLGPEDRVALVSFNGRQLNMHSGWSNSPSQLDTAFAAAAGQGAFGIRTGAALADTDLINSFDTTPTDLESLPQGPAGTGPPERDKSFQASTPEGRAAAAMEQIEIQLERVVMGVTATMRSFSQAQGRKVMLVLSGGWPMSVCDYLVGPRDPIASTGECINRGPEIYKPIYELANLLGYTLYPIDVPTSRFDVDASESDDIALARNGPGITGGQINPVSQTFREAELHTTLRTLANETGGLPMINEFRKASLEKVIEDTRSYYWLGFTPEWKGNDRNRKIKLRVKDPGLKVRYREGFRDLSRDEEIDFLVESTLLFGPLPGAGSLGVRFGDIPDRGRKVTVPVELMIPMDSITMLPHQGRYVAELELRIAALDEYGDRNEIIAVPVKLEGDQPPPEGAHAVYAMNIKIKRQPQDLVMSLYDPIGDRMMVAKGPFAP